MSGDPHIIVAGDLMRDIVVHPEGPMRRGSDVNASIRFLLGGSATNQARWLAHLGLGVVLYSRVGAADVADLTTQLEREGIFARLVADPERPTGSLIDLVEADGERSFLTDGGANRKLSAADVAGAVTGSTRLVMLSGYGFFAPEPRAAMLDLMRQAREKGVAIAVDAASAGHLADVGAANFLEWISGVDLLFANEEESALLAGTDEPDLQADRLTRSCRIFVRKSGARGAGVHASGETPVFAAASATHAVDTTGAGDAFAAGFVAEWLAGAPLGQCAENGNRIAARAVVRAGGAPLHER